LWDAEDGFYPTTKQLLFAAICNRKRFLEMPYNLNKKSFALAMYLFAIITQKISI